MGVRAPPVCFLRLVYSCALLRDILLQGRLFISRNWLCFSANLFGKDIKVGGVTGRPRVSDLRVDACACACACAGAQVCLPVVSVQLVKKHKTAGLVPNGLAITMDTGQKV